MTSTQSEYDVILRLPLFKQEFFRFEETNWESTTCKEKFGQICIGGYARALTTVKKLMEERSDKNPIYLNIGDNFVGTLWYELFGWNVTSTFLNMVSADATVTELPIFQL